MPLKALSSRRLAAFKSKVSKSKSKVSKSKSKVSQSKSGGHKVLLRYFKGAYKDLIRSFKGPSEEETLKSLLRDS